MDNVQHISQEQWDALVALMLQRQALTKRKADDKAKLAKARAPLAVKVQSERYFNAQIEQLTAAIEAIK